jgi:hypothetical protein
VACGELDLRGSDRILDSGSAAGRNGILCTSGAARDMDVFR